MKERLRYLDGIRGLMALCVVLSHFAGVYYPGLHCVDWAVQFGGAATMLVTVPLSVAVNGTIAVQFFFILSGALTAIGVFRRKDTDILQGAVNRYLRLLPVVFGSVFLTFLLMKFGWMWHLSIIDRVRGGDFLAGFCDFEPTFFGFLMDAFASTFLTQSKYVQPFWTIHYEMSGWLLTTVICYLSKGRPWRRLAYAAIAGYLVSIREYHYFAFVLGIIVADFYYYGEDETTFFSKLYTKLIRSKVFLAVLCVVGVYLGCIPLQGGVLWAYSWLPMGHGETVYRAAGIAMLIWCIMNCNPIQVFLERRLFQWLGKISFATYAFHWPLMLSFETGVFMVLNRVLSCDVSAIASFLLTLPVIYGVSWLAWYCLERKKLTDLIRRAISHKAV